MKNRRSTRSRASARPRWGDWEAPTSTWGVYQSVTIPIGASVGNNNITLASMPPVAPGNTVISLASTGAAQIEVDTKIIVLEFLSASASYTTWASGLYRGIYSTGASYNLQDPMNANDACRDNWIGPIKTDGWNYFPSSVIINPTARCVDSRSFTHKTKTMLQEGEALALSFSIKSFLVSGAVQTLWYVLWSRYRLTRAA